MENELLSLMGQGRFLALIFRANIYGAAKQFPLTEALRF